MLNSNFHISSQHDNLFRYICVISFDNGLTSSLKSSANGSISDFILGNSFMNIKNTKGPLVGFRSLVKEESTYWALVNLLNLQNELMDVHQSGISKMLLFSTSNLVSFMFIKSHHFMWAYLILLHKTSHTSCVLFFFWFPHAGSRESTSSVSSR